MDAAEPRGGYTGRGRGGPYPCALCRVSSSSSRWIGGVAAATALAAASAAACGSGDRGGTSAQASCVSGDAAASACEYSGPYSAGSGYLAGAPPYCSDPDGTQ